MKETPYVPAQTVVKHIQHSRSRVERIAKDIEFFRQGLRRLLQDGATLRIQLEDQPEKLARLEAGVLSLQYAASGVVSSLDQAMRFELSFQSECERFLHGKPPSTERGRPHLAYEGSREAAEGETPSPLARDGRPPKNGSAAVPIGKGAFGYVKAKGRELPPRFYKRADGETVPYTQDPMLAVGFFEEADPVTGTKKRVWVNAYDEVVAPPQGQDVAVSICGVGVGEPAPNGAPTLEEAPPPPEAGE